MAGIGSVGSGDPRLAEGDGRMVAEMAAVDSRDPATQTLADDATRDVGDALGGEPEVLEDRAGRRRSPK